MKNNFEELSDPTVRHLAKLVTKSKAWKENNSDWQRLDGYVKELVAKKELKGGSPEQLLWDRFQLNRTRQTKYRAELTRYMKKLKTYKREHVEPIIVSIVRDLAAIQEEFTEWQNAVEETLK